jgi:hypothetical protein
MGYPLGRTSNSGARSAGQDSTLPAGDHHAPEIMIAIQKATSITSAFPLSIPISTSLMVQGTAARPRFRCGHGDLPLLPPRLPAHHCRYPPGIGDYPYFTPSQVGLRSTSHSPGPPSSRDSCVRRRPGRREPVGDVRAAAVFCASSWLNIPFEIASPQLLQTGPPEAAAPAHP